MKLKKNYIGKSAGIIHAGGDKRTTTCKTHMVEKLGLCQVNVGNFSTVFQNDIYSIFRFAK